MTRPGSLAELGVGEPDVPCPPRHKRALDRDEQFERDHPSAPSNPEGEDR